MSRNIKLLVAYDGGDFSGWQRQGASVGGERTVQGVIEGALEKMHKEPVALTGSGRTDAGVHAAGQAANFHTNINSINPARFAPALNGLLPRDVRILEAAETRPDFHARFDAAMRTYRYHFIAGRYALPHESRYNLQIYRHPRVELLNAYGRLLLGERDCSIFAGAGDSSKSRNRYISRAFFFVEGDRLIFEISANAFLWKMVRSIAGTFLHYEQQGAPPEKLREIIASGERSLAGPTLPPPGLFLWKIDYYRE
ncbi:MAG: tRNA pseudouridine(38-40) synthase TruA [Treponema sp.]|jgi:tRNA pseudouridine38-40 synthase|nr:tRNA pseudouridine(38-40) synthase TruA [Treponema sp.]